MNDEARSYEYRKSLTVRSYFPHAHAETPGHETSTEAGQDRVSVGAATMLEAHVDSCRQGASRFVIGTAPEFGTTSKAFQTESLANPRPRANTRILEGWHEWINEPRRPSSHKATCLRGRLDSRPRQAVAASVGCVAMGPIAFAPNP